MKTATIAQNREDSGGESFTQLLPPEDDFLSEDDTIGDDGFAYTKLRDSEIITETTVPKFHHVKLKEIDYDKPHCRICIRSRKGAGKFRLVSPCACKGSSQFVHKKCLRKWCALKKTQQCEVCNIPYQAKYLKAPDLPKSHTDSLVSSVLLLSLLLGVFAVSVYLLLAHLYAVDFAFTGDCWLLLALTLAALFGLVTFVIWFGKNFRRIRTLRRSQLRTVYEPAPLNEPTTAERV